MSTTTTPVYAAGTEGAIDTGSLGAGANRSFDVDVSAKFEGQLHIKSTPSGTVAGTNGLKIEIFRKYGVTPTTGETACIVYTIPSVTSTAASIDVFLGTGKYSVKITNLDASNGLTDVSTTLDTVSSLQNA